MLQLQAFKKSFDDQLILDIPSMTFEKGVHWIKGRNGSGKSTLFNCLAGLSPYQGSISLNTQSLSAAPEQYKLKVNYSQSEPSFPEFLSGHDLIDFFSKLKQAEQAQVDSLLDELGIRSFATKPCGTYSSGMLKKLSILLAFLGKPDLIILDEPLITLDKETQQVVTGMIADRHQAGTSFLFATHQDFENALINATETYEVKDQTLNRL